MEEKNFETRTDLLGCENMVEYLWSKCNKPSEPFKPSGSKEIHSEVVYADRVYGGEILKNYLMDKEDFKESNISKTTEYDMDLATFKTSNEEGEFISEGTVCLIHKPDHKLYALFLYSEEGDVKKLKLLVKCKQKKKLFETFPTEIISFY